MKKKPKHREEVERLIVNGHRAGVCDASGNSVTNDDGRMVARPRYVGHVKLHKVYPKDGKPRVLVRDGQPVPLEEQTCES
jgi:hypothetical protein